MTALNLATICICHQESHQNHFSFQCIPKECIWSLQSYLRHCTICLRSEGRSRSHQNLFSFQCIPNQRIWSLHSYLRHRTICLQSEGQSQLNISKLSYPWLSNPAEMSESTFTHNLQSIVSSAIFVEKKENRRLIRIPTIHHTVSRSVALLPSCQS